MSGRVLLCKWASCPRQGVSFPTPEELALHVEEDHVDPCADHDLFICQWEGCKVYNQPSYSFGWLQRHVKQMHTKERPNKCLLNGCNMSFNSVDALQKHMLRHFEHSPTPSPSKKPPKPSPGRASSGSCSGPPAKEVVQVRAEEKVPSSGDVPQAPVVVEPEEVEARPEPKAEVKTEPSNNGQRSLHSKKATNSLKVKIPRRALFPITPYSKLPLAFNGAHFHSEVMDRKTMLVIRHTSNCLARYDVSSPTPSITLTAKVIGERIQDDGGEPEVLVRWSPQVVPDEWVLLSNLCSEKVVPFECLPSCQLSELSSKCFGFNKLQGRRSRRKP